MALLRAKSSSSGRLLRKQRHRNGVCMGRHSVESILERCRSRSIQENLTDEGRIRHAPGPEECLGRILNSPEITRLVIVEIKSPTPEKVNDMLDFCLENRIHLARFSEQYDVSGKNTSIFHFYDDEFALVFKLKFL